MPKSKQALFKFIVFCTTLSLENCNLLIFLKKKRIQTLYIDHNTNVSLEFTNANTWSNLN